LTRSLRPLPYLRLVRAGTLFSPGADVIAGLCLAGVAWSGDAFRTVFASILLYAAGMILNDHADRAVDAVQRPERPLPRGEIAPGVALLLGLACLLGCLLLTPIPRWHGVMVALVLAYDYVIKGNAIAGALTMGSLRAMNLLAPVMLLTTPVWHPALVYAAIGYGLYIVAVTLLGILEDARRIPAKAVRGLVMLPPLIVAVVVLALPERWPAAPLAFAAALWLTWRYRTGEWDQPRVRGAMRWLLLGTMVYTGLLALGAGHPIEALVIWALILPARWLSARIVALT
jgi:4-hydroxybenzoate polyprenyltransferase